ncbi:MAG TPA: GLPGLI family protein [Flavobacteriaceae bacterium]|nr:GLPGLI family protein [Flavobacteriaceae bacterium]
MRKTLLILLLFSSYLIHAQVKGEAEYLIRYEVDFVLDSTNREEVNHEVHRLYTGSTTSNYISEGMFYRDSIMQVMRNQPRGNWRAMRGAMENMPRSEFNASVFKDLKNSEVWVQHNLAQDRFLYQEKAVPMQWEFTDESKMIEQYMALKATTSFGGRDYEAWFTLEVPILDGPYVFNGLPGLILELYDTEKDYHFNLASMQPLKESYPIDSEDGNTKQVSKDEFIKSYKNYKENPSASFSRYLPSNFEMKDETGKTITRRDIERQAKEAADKRNNLIELW